MKKEKAKHRPELEVKNGEGQMQLPATGSCVANNFQ